jgi:hypothetical protein
MSTKVTIKAPIFDKKGKPEGTIDVTGKVAYLMVGEQRHKFLIQDSAIEGSTEKYLTHYGSGAKIASLSPVILRQFVARGSYAAKLQHRKAAQILVCDLIAKHGADKVNEKINAATIINR